MAKFFDLQLNKEVKLMPLFLSRSLRSLALSLSSLFASIFIYRSLLSVTARQDLALLAVFGFYLVLYSFKFIAMLCAEELSLKMGLKRQVHFGLLLLALCLLLLFFAQGRPYLFIFASPIWGLAAGFYWFGWHGLMIKSGRRDSYGKEIGLSGVVNAFLSAGTPVLGGLLISLSGYPTLFAVSLAFLLLSAVATRSVRGERTHYDTSLREVLTLFKTHKRITLAYVGEAASATIYSLAFPLFLFLILGGELALGEFLTLAGLLVALIGVVVGRWSDTRGRRAMIASGSAILFFVWLGRALTRAVGVLFILDVVDRIADKMVGIPLVAWTYEKALDGHSTGRAILFREVAVTSGAIFACLLLGAFVLCGVGFEVAFLAAAVFILLPLAVGGL